MRGTVNTTDVAPLRRSYGASCCQIGDLYLGQPSSRPAVVVVLHGGFWRPHRGLEMTAPLAIDLARRGWSTWNVEYRRTGPARWPATLNDCAAAIDYLAVLSVQYSLNLTSVVVLGHSAGGHLAVWSGGRAAVASRDGRASPAVRVNAVVSLAGILDLDRAARTRIGDGAVTDFTGAEPDELPHRYREADPLRRLPTGVRVRCVHSRSDERVPFEQSARYVAAARRTGDDATLLEVGGTHIDVIDPRKPAWQTVVTVLETLDLRAQL